MKHLPVLLCILVLLAGCAAAPAADDSQIPAASPARLLSLFPPSYDLSFRLEAFQGKSRTSYSHIRAVQADSGFYYASSAGEYYLFLRDGPDSYVLRRWDDPAGGSSPGRTLSFSEEMLSDFQDSLLHLGLLVRDVSALPQTGECTVASRHCRIYEGTAPAGDQFSCRQICCIDTATGLALAYTIQYRDQSGRTFTYRLTCERFVTEEVALPIPADGQEDKNRNTAGQTPQCSPLMLANGANSPLATKTSPVAGPCSVLPQDLTQVEYSLPRRCTSLCITRYSAYSIP